MTEFEIFVGTYENLESAYRKICERLEELNEEIEELTNDKNNALAKCDKEKEDEDE